MSVTQIHSGQTAYPFGGQDAPKPIDLPVNLDQYQRRLAKVANSRTLDPWAQTVLKRAAAGNWVDAFVLDRALVQAMQSSATRKGQSMDRRRLAADIARLAAAVGQTLQDALLDPSKIDVDARVTGMVDRATEELDRAAATIDKMTAEISELRASVQREGTRADEHATTVADLSTRLGMVLDDRDRHQRNLSRVERVLNYATTIMSQLDAARVRGYDDAIREDG